FKKPFQLFDQMCNDKILYSQCGDVVIATNAVVLGILGNSKSDEMNMKVLDLEQFLPILQSVAKNKNQGIYEDYAKGLWVFDKENGIIMGTEIHNLLVTLDKNMTEEEVEILVTRYEGTGGCINYLSGW
uniref:Uncharacterized protein n=1 Tax=Ictidomys tridecemlineatus TaxID=43179 RepID=A0A287DFT4_ICTTR